MAITQAQFNTLIDALLDAVTAKNEFVLLAKKQHAERDRELAQAKYNTALRTFDTIVFDAGVNYGAIDPVLTETYDYNATLQQNETAYDGLSSETSSVKMHANQEGHADNVSLRYVSSHLPKINLVDLREEFAGHLQFKHAYRVHIGQVYGALASALPEQAAEIEAFVYQGRYQPIDAQHPREFLREGVVKDDPALAASEASAADAPLNPSFLMKVLAHPATPIIGALLLIAGIVLICLAALSAIVLPPVAIGVSVGMAVGGAALIGGFFAARSKCCHRSPENDPGKPGDAAGAAASACENVSARPENDFDEAIQIANLVPATCYAEAVSDHVPYQPEMFHSSSISGRPRLVPVEEFHPSDDAYLAPMSY